MRINESVTVVIPYSGNYKLLSICLRGLSLQKIKPVKIVIVHDNCEFLGLSKYECGIPIYIEHNDSEKGHRSRIRNIGIKTVDTDWVFMIDEDVFLLPDYFKNLQDLVDDINFEVIIRGNLNNRKWDLTLPLDTLTQQFIGSIQVTQDELQRGSIVADNNWMIFCTGNLLASTFLLHKAGYFDENITGWGEEDSELGFRMWKVGGKFYSYQRLKAFHIKRDELIKLKGERNKNWKKNLEYTLEKHKGEEEYVKKRKHCLDFARRYSK